MDHVRELYQQVNRLADAIVNGFNARDERFAKYNAELSSVIVNLHNNIEALKEEIADLQESVGDLYLAGTDTNSPKGEEDV